MTVHLRTAQFGTWPSRSGTPSCAGPQRKPFHAALSPVMPLRGQRAWRELSLVTNPWPSCADTAAACCFLKFQSGPTENKT